MDPGPGPANVYSKLRVPKTHDRTENLQGLPQSDTIARAVKTKTSE
jgi:hypothetical protein